MSFVRRRAVVLEVTPAIAEEAAEVSFRHKLSTADAIIFTSARQSKAVLITGDTDFSRFQNVTVLK